MAKRPGLSNADARQQSRAALLLAGGRLFRDAWLKDPSPFRVLTTKDICVEAGYTPSALYVNWSSLDDYFRDLADSLLGASEDGLAPIYEDDFATLREVATSLLSQPLEEGLLALATRDFELVCASVQFDTQALVSSTVGRTWAREAAVAGFRAVDGWSADVYRIVLEAHGRTVRAPLTWLDVGATLQMLIEGAALRFRVDPDVVSANNGHAGLYPEAAVAVLIAHTEPA